MTVTVGSTSIEVKKDDTIFIEIKDVRTADGKLASAMEGSFKAVDKTRPALSEDVIEILPTATTFNVVFDEPLHLPTDVKFYLDGENITTVALDTDTTVEGQSTLVVTLADELEEGNHTFEIVGIQDYAGNTTLPSRVVTTIKVAEKDVTAEAPKVVDIVQIHDGAFIVVFDKAIDTAAGKITIKNLKGDNVDEVYNIGTEATLVAGYVNDDYDNAVAYEVQFTDAATPADDVYLNATNVIRTVVVEDYKVTVGGTDYKGAKYTSTERFVKDNVAPTIAKAVVNATKDDIEITFADAPFNGDTQAGTAADMIVKMVEGGITYTYTTNLNPSTILANKLALGLNDTDHPKLFKDGLLKPGAVITITLPDGIVKDNAADDTPQIDGEFDFVKDSVTVTVPGTSTGETVPQTGQQQVSFNTTLNAIEVKFVGEDLDPSTVTNKANYTFDGVALPAGTVIEYTEDDTKAATDPDRNIAYIYLPSNSVERWTLFVKY